MDHKKTTRNADNSTPDRVLHVTHILQTSAGIFLQRWHAMVFAGTCPGTPSSVIARARSEDAWGGVVRSHRGFRVMHREETLTACDVHWMPGYHTMQPVFVASPWGMRQQTPGMPPSYRTTETLIASLIEIMLSMPVALPLIPIVRQAAGQHLTAASILVCVVALYQMWWRHEEVGFVYWCCSLSYPVTTAKYWLLVAAMAYRWNSKKSVDWCALIRKHHRS